MNTSRPCPTCLMVEELIEQLIRKQMRDNRSVALATRGFVPEVRVRRSSRGKVIPMVRKRAHAG